MLLKVSLRTIPLAIALLAIVACGGEQRATAAGNDGAVDGVGEAPTIESGPAPLAAIDPQQYFGLYGDPANPNELRGTYVVTEARRPRAVDHFPDIPPGYVMIGAMWADVSPWYMKPLSATRFEQDFLSSFDPEPLRVVFELDAEGHAVALIFENREEEFPERARLGDVPESYQ